MLKRKKKLATAHCLLRSKSKVVKLATSQARRVTFAYVILFNLGSTHSITHDRIREGKMAERSKACDSSESLPSNGFLIFD